MQTEGHPGAHRQRQGVHRATGWPVPPCRDRCADLDTEHRLTPPMRPHTNGMLKRSNGRIKDVLQIHRFSGKDFEQTILRYVHLYNRQLPAIRFKGPAPATQLGSGMSNSLGCSRSSRMNTWDVTARLQPHCFSQPEGDGGGKGDGGKEDGVAPVVTCASPQGART